MIQGYIRYFIELLDIFCTLLSKLQGEDIWEVFFIDMLKLENVDYCVAKSNWSRRLRTKG